MTKLLFYFAITGWILSCVVHMASLAKIDITEKVPFGWVLHIGVIAVWVPTILLLKKNKSFNALQQARLENRMNPVSFSKILFRQTPKWLVYIAISGFLYAILNFFLFAISQPGVPDVWNGQYVLQDHGNLVKTLTEDEYHQYKAIEVRGFSGHWIAFYGLAIAILFPFARRE